MLVLEREAELARLRRAYESATNRSGRVVFVGGEAGIGKTTLVDAFAAGVEPPGRVAYGRCDALATPRALGPFVDVAAMLGVEGADDRDGLLGALAAAVRDGEPVVIIVEDAHWADGATVDLIALLGRRAADLPLLLVVTYRDEEVGAGHPLRQALGHLATASGATWIGLAPLSLDAVRALAEEAGASAESVYELTGGNPFYVTETLAAPAGSIATSVRMAVLARASRLPHGARSVLDAAAVVPGRVEDWLLGALCRPEPAAVDACVDAGVLLADRGDYVFRHELARRAIEHELSVSARRELHRAAAIALAARTESDPARIAYHAERGGDEELLARSAADACRRAVVRGAFDAAMRHGELALRFEHRLGGDETADLQVALADALGVLDRGDEAIALVGAAVQHWRAAGEARREAIALTTLGVQLTFGGRMSEAVSVAHRAAELLEPFGPSTSLAEAYIRLCGVYMLARDRDPAVRWGDRALALIDAIGDRSNLGYALIQRGSADLMDGRFDGIARIRRGIDVAGELGLDVQSTLGLSQIGSGCGELRRYDLALPALVEGIAVSKERHLETHRMYLAAWLARCRFDLGQWEDAEVLAAEVLAGSRSNAIARFVALNTLGWLRARRGDPDAWPVLDEALEIARRTGHLQRLWPCAVARAEAGWLAGDLAPHVALLEEQIELARECRHHIAVGELGVWLGRAEGRVRDLGAEPFASWNRGAHLDAAAGFRSMGCPYETASALACTGETASLREAFATFERLGALPAAERVATELRARGVRVSSRATPTETGNPGGLSDREVEVIRLVAAGFTNPQIGAALYISRKTAAHHVSHILTKLGVATRAEAASEAVRLGLTSG